MKRLAGLSLVATLLCAAAVAYAQGGKSIAGTWDFVTKSPQGERPGVLVIKQEGDKLTAAMKGPQGELALNSVALKGDDVTLVMTIDFQGNPMVITYTGKVAADGMKGTADFGGLAQGEFSAVPHKEGAAASSSATTSTQAASSGAAAADISGVWNFTVETAQGAGNPVFTFKQEGEKISGNYKGTFGEAPVNGALKGSDINFTMKVNAQGQEFTVTYTGKVEGNTMKGKANLGELGEATWTAKKQ